jgi:hypothetical protein
MLRTVLRSLSFTCSGAPRDKIWADLVPDVPPGSRHPPSVEALDHPATVLYMCHHGKLLRRELSDGRRAPAGTLLDGVPDALHLLKDAISMSVVRVFQATR